MENTKSKQEIQIVHSSDWNESNKLDAGQRAFVALLLSIVQRVEAERAQEQEQKTA